MSDFSLFAATVTCGVTAVIVSVSTRLNWHELTADVTFTILVCVNADGVRYSDNSITAIAYTVKILIYVCAISLEEEIEERT